jgi:thiamine kinase-like enzyme
MPLQDYEYASFNPVAYDIANHFCEMAADYHSEKPHILDYDKYPGTKVLKAICFFIVNFLLAVFMIHCLCSSFPSVPTAIDMDERKRFVQTYLTSSGNHIRVINLA